MAHCEFDFNKAFQKQLDDAQFGKNIVAFARKFRLVVRYADKTEGQYKLLKEDFERLYKDCNLDFDEEWKKVVEWGW